MPILITASNKPRNTADTKKIIDSFIGDIFFNDNRKNDKRNADKKSETIAVGDFILFRNIWIIVEFLMAEFDFCSNRFSIFVQSFFFLNLALDLTPFQDSDVI